MRPTQPVRALARTSRALPRIAPAPAPALAPALRTVRPAASRSASASSSSSRLSSSTLIAGPSVRSHSTAPPAPLEPIPRIADEDTYDIVVIGGGPAGLALATALVSHASLRDTRILLLEGGSLTPVREWDDAGVWSNRVSSLTAENVAWLQSIGAWANIAKQRSCPVDDIIVWANPDKDATPMLHFPGGDGALAYMTENINTQRALLRTLSSSENVDVREGARVQEMRYGEGRGWVGLRIGSPDGKDKWVRGSLVVGADGPNSPARAFAGIDTFGRAYDAHGVVSTLSLRPDPVWGHNTAFQRFLPTGPLAFLPLSADNATMVWSTLPGHAAALKRLPADALAVAVNAAFALSESDLAGLMDAILASDAAGSPLSAETITGILAALPAPDTPPDAPLPPVVTGIDPRSVASFPLRLSHADAYTAHRVALVGDAAHTTHPLAGQGLNAGLADARVLADVLADARAVGSDLGSVTALAPYPRQRYLPNHVMLAAVDKLELVFGARNPLINWARGTGLEVLNELGPLKAFFMANAGSAGAGAARSDEDRTFGRARAADALPGRPTGLPAALADAAEAFQTASQVAAAAGGMLAEGLKNALRRGADALEKK